MYQRIYIFISTICMLGNMTKGQNYYLISVCMICIVCMVTICRGLIKDQTYAKVFTAYNPLLDDFQLPTSTCTSVISCSKWCLSNQSCVSFIFNTDTSLCSLYSEYAECDIGDIVEHFYIIKGRQPRKICECNVAYNASFVNVALHKPVVLSSIHSSLSPDTRNYMVDGNLSTMFHTERTTNPYGIVDLQAIYDISYFYIANRITCCPERLRNFRIYVSDDQATWTQCIYYPGSVGIDCYLRAYTPCLGRYVKIQVFALDFFHLREFEVYTLM